jgi:hypothetical protein
MLTGSNRRLENEELHNLYSSVDVIREIKQRRLRRANMRHAWET